VIDSAQTDGRLQPCPTATDDLTLKPANFKLSNSNFHSTEEQAKALFRKTS
jgi:hypothetical protein